MDRSGIYCLEDLTHLEEPCYWLFSFGRICKPVLLRPCATFVLSCSTSFTSCTVYCLFKLLDQLLVATLSYEYMLTWSSEVGCFGYLLLCFFADVGSVVDWALVQSKQ